MMQPRQAKRLVVVSIVGSGLVVVFDKARTGEWPEPALFVGLAVTYVMLGFGADLAPTVAGPMALLFFTAVLLTRGSFVIDAFEKLTSNFRADARRKEMHVVPNKPGQPTGHHAVGGRKAVTK